MKGAPSTMSIIRDRYLACLGKYDLWLSATTQFCLTTHDTPIVLYVASLSEACAQCHCRLELHKTGRGECLACYACKRWTIEMFPQLGPHAAIRKILLLHGIT